FFARIPERVGFAGSLPALLYTERVRTAEKVFLRQEADLARALGVEPGKMSLQPRPEWVASAREALGTQEKIAALCIGSEWETKIWPPERYAALARLLAGRGLRPVLLGGPREKALAAKIGGAGKCIDTTGNEV